MERLMRRKFGIVAIAVVIAAAFVGGLSRRSIGKALTPKTAGAATNADNIESDYRAALNIVDSNYVGEIDYEKATQAAIQGMLWTLDPHSNYFTRAEYQKLKEDQDSRFYGIGVSILQHRDGVYIQALVENTPASRSGLRYGDRITEVDGKDAREWSSAEVSKNVRGERGVPVKVKVERVGSNDPLEFTIKRDAVPLPSIRNAYMIRPGVGYIGLTGGFQHTTDEELSEAISKLKEQGMRQMLLDLRGNPGGLLDQAIKVASRFIPSGAGRLHICRRRYGKPAARRAHQSQLRISFGDSRGRDTGSRARPHRRSNELRQGLGAESFQPAARLWPDLDDRTVLHALWPLAPARLLKRLAL